MTTRPQTPTHFPSLCQAIADQNHGLALKMLQQLPFRNRWDTLLLLNRTFTPSPSKDYARVLTHDLLYRAYREESIGNTDEAARLYRMLIQHNAGRKITQKAREGFMRIAVGRPRIQTPIPEQHDASSLTGVTHPTTKTVDHSTSLVLLQPVPVTEKQALAIKLAAILNTDPYTARLTLPSVEFRILRHGLTAQTGMLHQFLIAAGVKSCHLPLKAIQSIPVYDVLHIEAVEKHLVVQVRDPNRPSHGKRMVFEWSKIQQSVEGLLPLLEDVIDLNSQRKITHKTTTQDHAQILDLHFQNGQGILRFYDAGYQFNQGMPLVATDNPRNVLDTKTSWAQWRGLKQLIGQYLPPIAEHHKFEHFASSVVEQIELLTKIDAQIHLLRRHECYWDQAFHLYSALHYLQQS